MVVGKPDFELNSFGIQYKEKRVKYFQKDDDSLENTEQQLLDSRQDNDSKINTLKVPKIGESISIGGDDTTPKAPSSNLRTHKRLTSGNTPSSNISGKKYEKLTNPKTTTPKPTSSTRSQFMSKDPADKLSHTERKLRTDMEESGTKVDTSAAGITQRVKPLHGKNQDGSDTDTSKEVAPTFAPKQHVGSYSKGKLDSKDSKGKKRQIKFNGKPDEKKESSNRKQHKRSFKRLPKHVGDAPEGVNSETELVNQRNTKVGVGVDAHKKFQKNPQGELTSTQKPKVKNPDQFSATDGRKVDLNDQNRKSTAVQNHNKRGRDNSKWYNKEQRAAYKKIDPKDRNAQATYHTAQEKKYKKDVNTKKELSTAGSKISEKMRKRQAKKSNDIIMDMNIMKLDLMKRDGEKIGMGEKDTRQMQDRFNEDHLSDFPEVKGTKEGNEVERHFNEHMAPVGKSADETIFKAISLKLDLMKDGIEGGGKNTTRSTQDDDYESEMQTKEGQAADERGMNVQERDYSKRLYGGDAHHGRVPREHRDKPHAKPPVTKPYKGKKTDPRIPENKLTEKERTKIETTGLRNAGLTDSHIPKGNAWNYKQVPDKELPSSGKGSPSDLGKSADETIFKALSLKLDL